MLSGLETLDADPQVPGPQNRRFRPPGARRPAPDLQTGLLAPKTASGQTSWRQRWPPDGPAGAQDGPGCASQTPDPTPRFNKHTKECLMVRQNSTRRNLTLSGNQNCDSRHENNNLIFQNKPKESFTGRLSPKPR